MESHPDSLVIDRLGGPTEIGKLCIVSPQAVSQWRRSGIPRARRMYLELLQPAAFASPEGAPAVPSTELEVSDAA